MESEGSLSCLHKLVNSFYSEPNYSGTHLHILFLCMCYISLYLLTSLFFPSVVANYFLSSPFLLLTLHTTKLKFTLTIYKAKVVCSLYKRIHYPKFAFDGRDWSASQLLRSSHGVIDYYTHWVEDSVGLRTGFDALEKDQNLPMLRIKPQLHCSAAGSLITYSIF
jgi:hypothetical protein